MNVIKKMNWRFRIQKVKRYLISSFLYSIIIVTLVFCYYIFSTNHNLRTVELLRLISTLLVPVSIFAAFLSFKTNLIHSRRTKANEEVENIVNIIHKNRDILNLHVDFVNRAQENTPLDPHKEIHEWICKKKKGKTIYAKNKNCKMSKKGKDIRSALINIMNAYERLGIGIYHELIDEDIALDSLKGLVLKNYKLYELYIKHLRVNHKKEKAGIFFEWLFLRWSKEC